MVAACNVPPTVKVDRVGFQTRSSDIENLPLASAKNGVSALFHPGVPGVGLI